MAIRAVAALLSCFATMTIVIAETWPQWRGPTRDGHVRQASPWPDDLSKLKQTWRVELGPSYSGPIVAEDRVFVTESVDRDTEKVRALDRETGRELWSVEWRASLSVPFFAKKSGDWIRATPAYDGQSLFVASMQDTLICLDAVTGAQRWRVDFPDKFQTSQPAFGFVPSPLVDQDAVYTFAGQSFVKLDKSSGNIIWRTLEQPAEDMEQSGAFSSPIMGDIDGRRQVLVQTRTTLCGVAPESGEVLWRQVVPAFRGCNILTPTVFQNAVLTSTYQNKTFLYQISAGASGYEAREKWSNSKVKGYMSSPVIIDDYAFLHQGNGRFCCIDLRDGLETWRSEKFGEYWSLITNQGKILALDERGELLLIAADPKEFKLLDRRKVSEDDAWAHLAVADREVFVRERRALAAYSWK
ncbi:MAG: PQQ-binding-like beta-propeller repeat protein [Phycisphaerae bacterium]